jgi:hypothetical protein
MIAGLMFLACGESTEKKEATSGLKAVTVQEVIHVKDYSYLRVMDDGSEIWVAVQSSPVEVGKTYYIGGVMEMKNFESKELNRTFETIYFTDKISADAAGIPISDEMKSKEVNIGTTKPVTEKKEVKIEASEGTISIAELFENKAQYNNTIVKLKGEVTKFNPAIMNTNWIHIQDGTNYNGIFDLTLTSDAMVEMGDVITVEGKVTLDKDFGAGYFYEVIVENATVEK